MSPIGLNTDEEASASTVAGLINQLKANHIHRYFIENQTDPRLVRQIATAADAAPGGVIPGSVVDSERAGSYLSAGI